MIDNRSTPIFSTTYYALDWEYGRVPNLLLKYLHASPDVPFKITGIVHDEVWAPEVDGISLITTQDFLRMKHAVSTALIGFSRDQGWMDNVRAALPGVAFYQASELTRKLATAMKEEGLSGISVGSLMFPDVFEGQEKLSAADGTHFTDEHSKKVYAQYLEFLQRPSAACFADVASTPSTNCFDPEWFVLSDFTDRRRPAYVIEIADQQTSFPEQFVGFMGPEGKYFLITSDVSEAQRHRELLDGISPDFLEIKADVEKVPLHALADNTAMLIIKAPLSKVMPLPQQNTRMVIRAGDSAENFRTALDLSLATHPQGRRALRISSRYPNSLFLFSGPAAA